MTSNRDEFSVAGAMYKVNDSADISSLVPWVVPDILVDNRCLVPAKPSSRQLTGQTIS